MKNKYFRLGMSLLGISLSAIPSFAGSTHEAEIIIIHRLGSPHRSETKVRLLTDSHGKVHCGTPAVPRHQVQVAGFAGLTPPFSNEQVAETCESQVSWLVPGQATALATACYRFRQYPILDELLSRCLNI